MNIIAPCPQKPSYLLQQDWNNSSFVQDEVDDACYELRQILLQSQNNTKPICVCLDDPIITRTNNPLPLDSSFVPYQAIQAAIEPNRRPRSLSVGNTRPMASLVH
ncbi:uncharacterized protein BX664DRAFT_330723 [Halteromyces radiatus]|uniref:uncharacterized protein n=1 Tax=Halteromyces radiatus TaxID=101107 RepID=UPI00221E746D|nr:uncharacterized protein BX664DRAFT_330723 [Halteromyces radiatus]KAI8093844.1 hypothetical protein BX664DRAFT_330723 [Halteromyces radiatus]